MKTEKSAGLVIFKRSRGIKFLLLEYARRNDERGEHTYWDFPKGHIEEGEDEKSAALREAEEETGLKDLNIINGFRETIEYFFRAGDLIKKHVIFFLAETHSEEIKISEEHLNYCWLTYQEAMKKMEFKNAKRILTKAKEFLTHKKNLSEFV